ncbi:hypothetical protein BsWGS_09789 [Bradybaena similaris]
MMLLGAVLLLRAATEATLAAYDDHTRLSSDMNYQHNIKDYRNHPCRRTCQRDSPPMTCHYYFLVEQFATLSAACHGCPKNQTDCALPQCVAADGRARGILTVNRMMPGPVIDVCEGDIIEVQVDNQMQLGEGASIHWHGVRQIGSPHMDGTNMITQCPIHPYSTLTYRFKAADPGTHFWHSHSSLQRSDGFFGGLVIRKPYELDPHRHLYDYDLPEHYILLNDWSEKTTGETFALEFHSTGRNEPSTILVNGLGTSEQGPEMPFPVFKVKPGKRYRFRMAYNGIYNCPVYITVDGHPLLMIAADGRNFEPLEVDAFFIFSGERYDFVLKTKHKVSENFWIRFKGHGRCTGYLIQAAILRYEGTRGSQPEGTVTYDNTEETDSQRVLNGLSGNSTKTSVQIADLQLLGPDDDVHVLTRKPDKQFYISLAASKFEDERFKPPPIQNLTTAKPKPVRPNNHQLNYITSHLPPSPPLTQFENIPQDLFCNNRTVTEDCSQVLCMCVHLLNFDLGDIVEIVLVSFTNTLIHPMHMHGHSFRVVAMRSFYHDLTVDAVKAMDREGKIPRRTSRAPYKDTLTVHAQSVAIIRFRANNPGFWFFHCHIEFHAELGMSAILQAGQPGEMPKPPKGFPTCGSWRPEHRKTVATKEEQSATDAGISNGRSTTTLAVLIGVTGVIVISMITVVLVFRRRCEGKPGGLYKPVREVGGVRYNSLM